MSIASILMFDGEKQILVGANGTSCEKLLEPLLSRGSFERKGIPLKPDDLVYPRDILTFLRPPGKFVESPTESEMHFRDVMRLQEGESPAYLNFRPISALPDIPLTLAHHVFGDFLDKVNKCGNSESGGDDSKAVLDLVAATSAYYKERCIREKVRNILSTYLDLFVPDLPLPSICFSAREGGSALAFVQVKPSAASDNVDYYCEGIQSYAWFWSNFPDLAAEFKDTCYPAFLVELLGPCLRVSALARVGRKVCAQPLTSFVSLLPMLGYNSRLFGEAIGVLSALKKALHQLARFYENFQSQSGRVGTVFWDFSIPYPLHRLTTLTPKRFGNRLVYYLLQENKIVKYAERYGILVHKAWAAAGLAPELIEHRLVSGGWHEIVMENLGQGWEILAECLDAHDLRFQVLNALRSAHRLPVDGPTSFGVHGDCRDCNIMIRRCSEGRVDVRFIDFEWAGLDGLSRYPLFMNTVQLKWPKGAEDNAVMHQEHDIQLLAMGGAQV